MAKLEPRREPALFLSATYLSMIDTLLASILGLFSCSGLDLAEWEPAPDFPTAKPRAKVYTSPLSNSDTDTVLACQWKDAMVLPRDIFLFGFKIRADCRL